MKYTVVMKPALIDKGDPFDADRYRRAISVDLPTKDEAEIVAAGIRKKKKDLFHVKVIEVRDLK